MPINNCSKCGKTINLAHWDGEDHLLCEDCSSGKSAVIKEIHCSFEGICGYHPCCGDKIEDCKYYKDTMEKVLEMLADDCPNYDNCSESAIENYEPMPNEGRD